MITTTLEQSKKLKELGVPQDTAIAYWHEYIGKKSGVREWHLVVGANYNQTPSGSTHHSRWSERIAAYTLQELIEWLGNDFQKIERRLLMGYEAMSIDEVWGKGVTALEAVYNLAVAIKSKQQDATTPSKPTVHIGGWKLGNGRLFGIVSDHHDFPIETFVATSYIVKKNPVKGDIIETRNTFYVLGNPALPTEGGRAV